jgi:hypothetical protein
VSAVLGSKTAQDPSSQAPEMLADGLIVGVLEHTCVIVN